MTLRPNWNVDPDNVETVSLRVRWDEPDEHGNPVRCSLSVSEAIEVARGAAAKRGYVYDDATAALEDFLTVHWAWLE